MGSGAAFWFEHDVELHDGDLFSVFDDGATPAREPASRALLLRLQPSARRVEVVVAFSHPGVLAAALGNVQLLAGGTMVVGWGTAPYYSELSRSGTLLYDARLPAKDDSYRAYRYGWVGRPDTTPLLSASLQGGSLHLAMSWNGETGISRWRILTGATSSRLRTVATVANGGFQTTASIVRPGAVVEVEALASSGQVLGHSAAVRP